MTSFPEQVHFDYDALTDWLLVWRGEPRVAESREVAPGFYVRLAWGTADVVGLEVLDCCARFGVTQENIDTEFATELLAKTSRAPIPAV